MVIGRETSCLDGHLPCQLKGVMYTGIDNLNFRKFG